MTAEDKSDDRSIHVQGNVDSSAIVVGDGNTVTYTTNVFSPNVFSLREKVAP